MATHKITLTTVGSGISSTLDLYRNTGTAWVLHTANVSKSALISGYQFVDNTGSTKFKVVDKGVCGTEKLFECIAPTTTLLPTTTEPLVPPTTLEPTTTAASKNLILSWNETSCTLDESSPDSPWKTISLDLVLSEPLVGFETANVTLNCSLQNQATDAPQQISSVTLYKNGSTQVDQIALFSTSPANKSGAIPIVITASDNNFRVELRVSVDGDNATSGSTTASIPLVLSYGSTNVIVTNPVTDPTVSVFPNGVNESCA